MELQGLAEEREETTRFIEIVTFPVSETSNQTSPTVMPSTEPSRKATDYPKGWGRGGGRAGVRWGGVEWGWGGR